VTVLNPGGQFYASIQDTAGNSGPGHFYNLMASCYNTTFFDQEIESDSLDPALNTPVAMEESTNTAGFYFGRFIGYFEPFDLERSKTDDFDAYAVEQGLGTGKFVNVYVDGGTAGGLAGELTVTLWRSTGGAPVQLAQAVGVDADIQNYELTAQDTTLVVTVESDGVAQGRGAHYQALVTVSDDEQ
jgi:hypothetical protein